MYEWEIGQWVLYFMVMIMIGLVIGDV